MRFLVSKIKKKTLIKNLEAFPFEGIEIAKYIINKCFEDGHPISNLYLQNIMYFLQIHFSKKYDKPLFIEDFEAWEFGPCIPDIYHEFCGFGSRKIPTQNLRKRLTIHPLIKKEMDEVIEKKRDLPLWELCEETQREDGAWSLIYGCGKGNKRIIPTELIIILK